MRWFYILSITAVVGLCCLPLFLLRGTDEESYARGMVLRLTYPAPVRSIDPATNSDEISSIIQSNIYEGLYDYHYLKRPLEIVNELADSSPEISADGLTYTIRLKKNVLFQRNPCFGKDPGGRHEWNTRAVRAEDFIYAFKRIADFHINTGLAWAFLANRIVGLDEYRELTRTYKAGDFSRYNLPVEGMSAPDSLTLRLRLKGPFPQLIYILALPVYAPIPHEAIDHWLTTVDDGSGNRKSLKVEERSPEILERDAVVGTGPFLLSTWVRKGKIVLKKNPDFREEYYPSEGEPASKEYPGDSALGLLDDAGKRIPFLDEIQFRYVEETYAAWMLFLSNQADFGGIPIETFRAVISPDKKLLDKWQKKNIRVNHAPDPGVYYLVFNMEDPVVGKSKALRQAICLGYDEESEIKILSEGRALRAVNILPSMLTGWKEAGPGPYCHYDLTAARRKIAEAKQELAAAGVLQNGEVPELKIDLDDGVYATRLAEFIKQQFANMGLRLKVVYNDWPTLLRKQENKQTQIYSSGWLADYPDAEDFLQLFYSGNIDKGTNNSNYRNAEFDRLYEQVRVMQESAERTAIYARMVNIVSDDCPVFPMNEQEIFQLYHEWVKNVKMHPIAKSNLKYRRIDMAERRKSGGDN